MFIFVRVMISLGALVLVPVAFVELASDLVGEKGGGGVPGGGYGNASSIAAVDFSLRGEGSMGLISTLVRVI